MMTDAEKKLVTDLELLYDRWSREWMRRVITDTHPTREDERQHLIELKKVIVNHASNRFDDAVKDFISELEKIES